jgi:hypothetical protein
MAEKFARRGVLAAEFEQWSGTQLRQCFLKGFHCS